MKICGLFLFAICVVLTQAASDKVLVLLDDPLVLNTHSQYFSDLIHRGYDLSFRSASDKKLHVKDWDEWLYDKLILFAPTAEGKSSVLLKCVVLMTGGMRITAFLQPCAGTLPLSSKSCL
jgi:hypothetical protein